MKEGGDDQMPAASVSDAAPMQQGERKRPLYATCVGAVLLFSAAAAAYLSAGRGEQSISPTSTSDTAAAAVETLASRRRLKRKNKTQPKKKKKEEPPVHVVYASDDLSLAGVEASIRSVMAHSSERVEFTFIGNAPLASLPEVNFVNLQEAADKYKVEEFTNPMYERKGKNKRDKDVHLNNNYANYVRFVMDSLLPDVSKAMWIDSDTIVRCDVVKLLRNTLPVESEYMIAAVPVEGRPMGLFPKARDEFKDIRVTFNAGVYVVDLDKWRAAGMTETMRKFAMRNREELIYKYGSQPPLVLTFRENFEHLPLSWNVKVGKVSEEQVQDACLLHWAGPDKPWNGRGKHIELWQPYDIDFSEEDLH